MLAIPRDGERPGLNDCHPRQVDLGFYTMPRRGSSVSRVRTLACNCGTIRRSPVEFKADASIVFDFLDAMPKIIENLSGIAGTGE